MNNTNHKTIELAESFFRFCKKNPSLRFWQALHAWAGIPNIFAGHFLISDDPKVFTKNMKDTFYWNEKNK